MFILFRQLSKLSKNQQNLEIGKHSDLILLKEYFLLACLPSQMSIEILENILLVKSLWP